MKTIEIVIIAVVASIIIIGFILTMKIGKGNHPGSDGEGIERDTQDTEQ